MSELIIDDSIEKIDSEEALKKVDMLKDLVHSDEFKKAVDTCTDKHLEIMTSIKPEIKECREDFADSAVSVFKDLGLKKKELKQKAREFSSVFNKVLPYYDEDLKNDAGETKLSKIASQVAFLLKWFDFLGDDRLKEHLAFNGINIDSSNIAKLTATYAGIDASAKTMKQCLDDAVMKNGKIREISKALSEELYCDNVPAALQFDKDVNPIGLKPSAFNKICKVNAMKKTQKKEKTEKMLASLAEKSVFNEASEQLMQETLSDLMA